MLRDGRILRQGDKDQLLTNEGLSDLFGLPAVVDRRGDWFSMRVD